MGVKKEIERRFFPKRKDLPKNLRTKQSHKIKQGFFKVKGTGFRVRKIDNSYFLTNKSGQGMVRPEDEVEISKKAFKGLWPKTKGARIWKIRYYLQQKSGLVFEVNKYLRKLSGLYTIEVEFTSVARAKKFQPPDWFGKEVTDDKRYTNRSLAINGLPDK